MHDGIISFHTIRRPRNNAEKHNGSPAPTQPPCHSPPLLKNNNRKIKIMKRRNPNNPNERKPPMGDGYELKLNFQLNSNQLFHIPLPFNSVCFQAIVQWSSIVKLCFRLVSRWNIPSVKWGPLECPKAYGKFHLHSHPCCNVELVCAYSNGWLPAATCKHRFVGVPCIGTIVLTYNSTSRLRRIWIF